MVPPGGARDGSLTFGSVAGRRYMVILSDASIRVCVESQPKADPPRRASLLGPPTSIPTFSFCSHTLHVFTLIFPLILFTCSSPTLFMNSSFICHLFLLFTHLYFNVNTSSIIQSRIYSSTVSLLTIFICLMASHIYLFTIYFWHSSSTYSFTYLYFSVNTSSFTQSLRDSSTLSLLTKFIYLETSHMCLFTVYLYVYSH